jgi:hypothetical protein
LGGDSKAPRAPQATTLTDQPVAAYAKPRADANGAGDIQPARTSGPPAGGGTKFAKADLARAEQGARPKMKTYKPIERGVWTMNASQRSWKRRWPIGLGLTAVALAGLAGSYAIARPPRDAGPAEGRSATGTIERFTTAPRGELDGAVLSDGTLVHWPPHLGASIGALVARGDRIEVVGRRETNPEGQTQLEAATITNLGSNRSLAIDDGPPSRGPERVATRRGGPPEDARRVEGEIRRFTTAPRGEVDGAVLTNGTVIHWPPHLENQFTGIVDEGDRVRAEGFMETGPAGDTHFEVSRLTNVGSGKSSENPDAAAAPRRDDRDPRSSDDRRLRALEDQVEQLWREIDRLRHER